MERIVKLFLIVSLFFSATEVFSAENPVYIKPLNIQNPTQIKTQPVSQNNYDVNSRTVYQMNSFDNCTKKYNMQEERLFLLSLASINANKFVIKEIQSKNGYILFEVINRQFLLTISRIDSKVAMVKIVPADNNYYFPYGIISNFFKYIDLNLLTPIEKLS